jgi:hypothetical protein
MSSEYVIPVPAPETSPTSPAASNYNYNSYVIPIAAPETSPTSPTASNSNHISEQTPGSIPGPQRHLHEWNDRGDPRTWSVADVAGWLQSKNVSHHVVEAFQNEGITGQLFIELTKDDMTSIGVKTYGEKLELVKLIKQLKEEWRIEDEVGSGVVKEGGVGSEAVRMEDEKGIKSTDAPPTYRAL